MSASDIKSRYIYYIAEVSKHLQGDWLTVLQQVMNVLLEYIYLYSSCLIVLD